MNPINTSRRGFLASLATSPTLALATPTPSRPEVTFSRTPTARIGEEPGVTLVELTRRFLALADVLAGRISDAETALDRHNEAEEQGALPIAEVVRMWSDYCDLDNLAVRVIDDRKALYRVIRHGVISLLGEAGIHPGETLKEEYMGWARPLAILHAGEFAYVLVGAFWCFYGEPYPMEEWGDTEVVILDTIGGGR